MAAADVKLLGIWPSPFVIRVEMALKVKSIEFELLQENMLNKSELLLKSNPVYKKIPVLIHDEKPICESLVILEYIDEAWPNSPSILPCDPHDRAMSRFWAAYIDQKWFPLLLELKNAERKEAKAAVLDIITEGNLLLEEAFIKISKGKPFFGGDSIGYLDIVLGSLLAQVKLQEILDEMKILDQTNMPSLAEWDQRFCSDEVVKDLIPEPEKLVELYQKYQEMKKAASN